MAVANNNIVHKQNKVKFNFICAKNPLFDSSLSLNDEENRIFKINKNMRENIVIPVKKKFK